MPLIAETGGLNAMLVDSTALPEQVVDDVVTSAFMSAGQRCSALRLLFLQEEIADAVIEMIAGAMDELVIGDPADLETDVGPVITGPRKRDSNRHIERMRREARIIKACRLDESHAHGSFVAPHLIELEQRVAADARGIRPLAARGALSIQRHRQGARRDPRHATTV